MDFTALPIEYVAGSAALLVVSIVAGLRCCCTTSTEVGTGAVTYEDERNSRLAMLLMILLADKPNRKYVRMAKQIGVDHILTDDSLFDTDDSDSE
jgi:hypothetical protein